MLLQLNFIYSGTHHSRIAQTFLELIDKLIEGTINISDPDASVFLKNHLVGLHHQMILY